ncbi:acetate/propionate family kinase [Nocardioides sp. cx-173]|uniref:acetate/propionate family kinase n=1 Tax=Nocardioides sp. cx-173 TaxID=2898796 RepID=UPI001E29AF11|nr:acetate/propionate family kinase [Nocardioides sp. cx-173]MCD4524983.1 acetate/propionate family kinase [Nocardioides sp. cx-173]UGB40309.1 acetate/propionate family kinase [Nocardioides sp. cx-173]
MTDSAKLLVLNCGSSSLKYDLFAPWAGDAEPVRVATGFIEGVGPGTARLRHDPPLTGHRGPVQEVEARDHEAALHVVLDVLRDDWAGLETLGAVAHRVVHGGPDLSRPAVVDDAVLEAIESAAVLAPLHNPAALAGIRAVESLWPGLPQVVVFDTAFHATLPAAASTYAIPQELARRHHLRRWGFHGISHQYVSARTADVLGVPADRVSLVSCHIGNGVSVTAVREGRSIDTSMGFTPMDGAVMGTRSGSIDPGAVLHLGRTGLSPDEVEDLLQHRSGMLGLCGDSDMRRVRERADAGDAETVLALEVYSHRLRSLVSSYLGQLPDLHAVVFTAGVGEHDPALRAEVIAPLAHLGLQLDPDANAAAVGGDRPARIDAGGTPVLVVPTDEGAQVAREAHSALFGPVPQ